MMEGDLESLRKLDRLITSNNATVADLLEQAMVAAEISNDTDSDMLIDNGPLVTMALTLMNLQKQMLTLMAQQNSAGIGESNPYHGVTWTDTTSGRVTPWFTETTHIDSDKWYTWNIKTGT